MKNKYCYFPILKTTDAELKAYEMLDEQVTSAILPIFELTKSRLSKSNTNQTIYKRIEKLKNLVNDKPFILDLTTEPKLWNEEIEEILSSNDNGYKLWVDLVKKIKSDKCNIIPVIHYNPYFVTDVKLEIQELQKLSNNLAFRVSVLDEDLMEYLRNISTILNFNNLILILDAEFQSLNSGNPDKSHIFKDKVYKIIKKFPNIKAILCAFSSFPESVTRTGYGGEEKGEFYRSEKITYNSLLNSILDESGKPLTNLLHCDYASVHPKRYDITGGQWIPRIDYLNDIKMFYYRYKREEGGYAKAALNVVNDANYANSSTWGDNEIIVASGGIPNGKAPSHWISVRINLYISKQCTELIKANQMIL